MTHGSVAALVTSLWSFNFPFPPAAIDNNLEVYSHQGWRTLGQESARHLHSFSALPLTLLTSSPMLQSHGVLRVVLAMPHFHTVILEASLLTTKLTYCSSSLEVQAMNSCLHLAFYLYSCHPTHRYIDWTMFILSPQWFLSLLSLFQKCLHSLSLFCLPYECIPLGCFLCQACWHLPSCKWAPVFSATIAFAYLWCSCMSWFTSMCNLLSY